MVLLALRKKWGRRGTNARDIGKKLIIWAMKEDWILVLNARGKCWEFSKRALMWSEVLKAHSVCWMEKLFLKGRHGRIEKKR